MKHVHRSYDQGHSTMPGARPFPDPLGVKPGRPELREANGQDLLLSTTGLSLDVSRG
jgi:hypothetical protein